MSGSDTADAQHDLTRFEPDGEAGSAYFQNVIRLPGYWPVDDDCLELKPTGFCEDGHVQLGGASPCGTRSCSEHWYSWRRQAAQNAVARLAAYRYHQDGWGKRMLHTVASPPQERRWTASRFWGIRSETYRLQEAHGARGGVCVPHPYSTSDAGDRLFEEAVEAGEIDPEHGRWRYLRERADDWDEMQEYIDAAPHFHHLTAWADLDGDEIREELPGGWVVHNVRSLDRLYIWEDDVPRRVRHGRDQSGGEVVQDGFEDMARLSMYLLSHGGVQLSVGDEIGAKQTITYWGDIHPNSFDPEAELEEREWRRIKQLAAAAVGTAELEIDEDGELEEVTETCGREDCEQPVHPLSDLDDFVSRVEWVEGLDYDQQCEIWGVKCWGADRPPPGGGDSSVATDREPFLEWLRRIGRRRLEQNPWYQVGQAAD